MSRSKGSALYPKIDQGGLSSDEDCLFEEEEVEISVGRTPGKGRTSRTRSPYDYVPSPSSRSRLSNSMTPLSKYDHKPRNMEFDGNKFVASTRRRSSGSDHRRNDDAVDRSEVTFSEFVEYHSEPGEDEGRRSEVGEQADEVVGVCGLKMWQVIVLGCFIGLLLGIVYRAGPGGLYLGFLPRDNFLKCPPEEFGQLCLESPQVSLAQLHLEPLKTQVHIRAGQFDCGERKVHTRGITVEELRKGLPTSAERGGDVVRTILTLVVYNPHWNIVWLEPDGKEVKEWLRTPNPKDQLQSTYPSISLRCRVSMIISSMWDKLKIILLVVIAVVVLVVAVRWRINKTKMAERSKFLMVDKILNVLRRHYEAMQRKKNLIPYLAIIHVRDMLITPSERDRKQKTWEEACAWIAKFESRVRVERQRIAGEDFDVWKWIQEDPPPTEDTVFLNDGAKIESSSVTIVASSRKKNWYNGTTFDDASGRNNSRINSPYGSPSPCIRLKNMFEAVKHMKDEQSKEIEDSVLDRCVSHGGVIHIYVDRRSPFGCVYLKMIGVESAVKAYKALHGGWYKGKLVTAKYIPPEKYHKWFPVASNAKDHIFPSS